jgi:SAM-dependent methyltransferase
MEGWEDGFPCPLCGNRERFRRLLEPRVWIGEQHFADLRGKIAISQCGNCGVEITKPRPTAERLNRFYAAPGYGCHTLEGSNDPRVVLNLVPQPGAARQGSWLDFGCGAGALIEAAQAQGWDARGVEVGTLARTRLIEAGHRVYATLEECRASGFRPDVVSMETVLEHIADPVGLLTGLRGIMPRGGRFVVVVPNVQSLRARAGAWMSVDKYPNAQRHTAFPIHLVYYTARQLSQLVERCGFQVERRGAYGMGLEIFDRAGGSTCGCHDPAPASRTSEGRSRGKRLQWVRDGVKTAISRLSLGEHIYLVARS